MNTRMTPDQEMIEKIKEIQTKIAELEGIVQADILNVSFETISRIENMASDLYSSASSMKKLRGIKLEKAYSELEKAFIAKLSEA